jgi:hypothetical protein
MYSISDATPEDNRDLTELFNKYPVSSGISYTLDRSPDYFSFCNLHDAYKVITARNEHLAGAITITFSQVFLENQVKNIAYMGELRLDMSARGTGLGDRLMQAGLEACRQAGNDVPIFASVLKGNTPGFKKLANLGRDKLANFFPVAEIILYFILPLSLKRLNPLVKDYTVRPAGKEDLPEMLALWNMVNSEKNLAAVLNTETFEKWLAKAWGLEISSYLLAFDRNNRLRGFLGTWDQSAIRRITIWSESLPVKFIRKTWNLLRPLSGMALFPAPGQSLSFYNVTNLCIPEEEAETFSLLLYHAFKTVRENKSVFLAVALDKKDPLNRQLKGFISSGSELVLLSNYDYNNISTHKNRLYHLEISKG